MADKQIIVGGVDVSECPYYIDSDGSCSSHDCECIKCIHNECFYKDYKRKEQECEQWQKELDKTHLLMLQKQDELIKEIFKNDQLKSENKDLKSVRDMWMSKCEQETKTSEFFQDRFDDLKRTISKIKEIAEILAPMTDEYENCYDRDRCFECDFTEDCPYFNTKRIIQICDEAINE